MNDVIHPLSTQPSSNMNTKTVVISLIVIVLVGLLSGYLLSGMKHTTMQATNTQTTGTTASTSVKSGQTFGVKDTKNFKDNTEGTLKKGGIAGESEYHLERTGGESQNVYLTSSTVDLSQFIDKKIKVWGQTINSEKAGWFMDVGTVQVL